MQTTGGGLYKSGLSLSGDNGHYGTASVQLTASLTEMSRILVLVEFIT